MQHEKFVHNLVSAAWMGPRPGIICYWDSIGSNQGLGLHVLDVVRKAFLLVSPEAPVSRPTSGSYRKSPSATRLVEYGIRFKSRSPASLKDIEFRHGILSLPQIVLSDGAEHTILNHMAFERLHTGAGNDVTSYVYFMRNLINSPQDVAFLQSQGIICNALGSRTEVAYLFDQLALSRVVAFNLDAALDDVYQQMKDQCKRTCSLLRANRHLIDLRHAYLNSPWTFISIFLLPLTVIQTVYDILQYYKAN